MTTLTSLPPTTAPARKRRGRGYGSGKGGHTTGRGAKGQKARSQTHLWFEGGQLPLIKRLPFQRGKGRFKPLKQNPLIVNLKYLNRLPQGAPVNLDTLVKAGIIRLSDAKKYGVKILGEGNLDRPVTVSLPTSKSAALKIQKAGGRVITTTAQPKSQKTQPSTPPLTQKTASTLPRKPSRKPAKIKPPPPSPKHTRVRLKPRTKPVTKKIAASKDKLAKTSRV